MKLNVNIASLFLLAALLAGGCSKSGQSQGDSAADSVTYPTVMDTTDSIEAAGDSAKDEKKEEELRNTFSSTQAALDHMKQSGNWDKYQSGILPRMAEENLEYCGKLLNNKHSRFIVVDKRRMMVILYNKYGQVEKEYGMVCGRNYGTKHRKSDCRTPEGFFSCSGIYDSTDWLYTNDNGYTSPVRGAFGPRFIRLKTPVTSSVGIHGAGKDYTLGKRLSHGCIRLKNECILELVKYAEIGMPIIVSPGEQDMLVNHREGYNVPAVTTFGEKLVPDYAADKKRQEQLAKQKADKKAQEAAEAEAESSEGSSAENPENASAAGNEAAPVEPKTAPNDTVR